MRHAAGEGVSAIDCLQLLRSELHFAQGITTDSKKEKEIVNLVWERCKKQAEFKEVSSFKIQGYSTPVLTTQRQLQALKPYSLISHSFRVK